MIDLKFTAARLVSVVNYGRKHSWSKVDLRIRRSLNFMYLHASCRAVIFPILYAFHRRNVPSCLLMCVTKHIVHSSTPRNP